MTYRLPLRERQRFADAKRWRYRVDPEYRLACINKERARRGRGPLTELPPANLSEMQCPHRPKSRPAKNWQRRRDERGRFARQWVGMADIHVGLADSCASYASRPFETEAAECSV